VRYVNSSLNLIFPAAPNEDRNTTHVIYMRAASNIGVEAYKEIFIDFIVPPKKILVRNVTAPVKTVLPPTDFNASKLWEDRNVTNKTKEEVPVEVEKEAKPVVLRIKEISRNGLMRVQFNQPLKVPPFID